MKAHIFDLDTIIINDSKICIIDKDNSRNVLKRINQSDYNLIKNGIYKNQGNRLEYNGNIFWLPSDMMEDINVICKKNKIGLDNIGFSMREFNDKEKIDERNIKINYDLLKHLKNSKDDIYIICSKNTRINYNSIIEKIENDLNDMGILVKEYYYINENFYNRDSDINAYNKVKIVLQHLLGYKTNYNMFVDEKVINYDEVYFYDDDQKPLNLLNNINDFLRKLIDNTEDALKIKIKEVLRNDNNVIHINQVGSNKLNPYINKIVNLEWQNLVKTFESFINKKSFK